MNINELRKICQKEKLKRNTGLTLKNRKISIYFTWVMIRLGISANAVSVSGILLGVAGSLLFIPGKWDLNLTGVFLLYLSLTCDQVDGELARYYKTVNLNGVYLDEIRHIVIYSITIFCLSFPAARDMESNIVFLIGFVGAMMLIIGGRIEEQLSKLIFVEKVLLNDNFEGGTFSMRSEYVEPENKQNNKAAEIKDTPCLSKLKRCFAVLFYGGVHYLSHQVIILLWLLGVTIIDHFVLHNYKLFEYCSLQSFIFIAFSILETVVTIRVIYGHFQLNKVEKDCKRFVTECRKFSG